MEKTQYQTWLDGRLIDYHTLGEMAWIAALAEAKRSILDRCAETKGRRQVIAILDQLSK